MAAKIDVDAFVKEHQDEITELVNKSLNRAGDTIQQKVARGEIQSNMQEVLPVLLYETLVTHTVATLRLVAEMVSENETGSPGA